MLICLLICVLNTIFCLYLARERKQWDVVLTEEELKNEQERKIREEKLNRVFDYDPYR